MVHCNLSCKYGECSFSCSGENLKIFEKHLEECKYFPVKCSNKLCMYTTQRKLMKFHSEECGFAIEKCPNGNCSLEIQRREKSSHLKKCPYQMVSCTNKPFGCMSIMARKDLDNHKKTCPLRPTPCERCGEPIRSSPKHICPFDTERCPHCNKEFRIKNFDSHQNSCLTTCKLCERYIPKSEIRHHKCPIKQCNNLICEYKDSPLRVEQHMNECEYRPVKCSFCQKNFLAKQLKRHTSMCENRVRCQTCHRYVEISSKPVHDLLDSFANLVETTCQTCGEKDKSGLINGQQDLNLQNEKNTTEAVFSADNVNDQQLQKRNDRFSEKSSSKENTVSDLSIILGQYLVHNVNENKNNEEVAGIHDKFPSLSDCSKSRKRFLILWEEIDKNPPKLQGKLGDIEFNILNFH